jgi:segregation and condensation protein B
MSKRNGIEGVEEEAVVGEVDPVTGEPVDAVDEELLAESVGEDAPPLLAVIEAVLFASAEPVPMRRLARLLSSWSRPEIEEAVAALKKHLETEERGIRLVEAAGGLQLRSAERLAPWVKRFFAERPPRLSRPVLETLAIVAYRQPVTRGEVEQIRGVNCDAVLGALTTRGLIRVQGRRPSPGRPAEYATTEAFLELFTLRDLGELPPLPDPAALANLIAGSSDEEGEGDVGNAAAEGDAERATPEDPEPGGDGLAAGGRGADPERPRAGERQSGEGAGDPRRSGSGSDHR